MSLSILFVIVLLIGGVFFLKDKKSDQVVENSTEYILEENQDKTVTYENGDFVYIPSNEEIGYDSEEKIYFYENLLNIYLTSEVTDDQAEELAEIVDGTIVGKIQGSINMLQLQVEERSIDELNEFANRFENHELVKFADSSTPSSISDLNNNDASKDSEKDDKVDRDWWTDAIKASEAWDYIDNNEDEFEPVDVAVLEIGRLGKEETDIYDDDLKTNVSEVNNKDGKDFRRINRDKEKIIDSHARWVTKFLVADPNEEPKNFRGVAAGEADVHFTAMGDDIDKYTITESIKSLWTVPEPYIMSIIKSNLENDIRIINNSWGNPIFSKNKWEEESYKEQNTYEKYEEAHKESIDKVSAQLIVALDDLLSERKDDSSDSKHSDFLIIQGAGNGQGLFEHEEDKSEDEESSAETATEAKNSGFFTNINQKTYSDALETGANIENKLEDIQSHIIIVGGAEFNEDKNGYQSPEWVSYGSAVDIVAPAVDLCIVSEKEDDDADNLCKDSDDETPVSGTSYATPMVSGAAALIWSYIPEMDAGEVKKLLINSAEDSVVEDKGDKDLYPMLNITAFLNGIPPIKTVGKEIDFSDSSYYKELIETYRTAISDEWDQSALEEEDLGPIRDNPQPLPSNYGYELRDINGNGLPELVVGVNGEGEETEVYEIYTLQDKKPVKVFENGVRIEINIYENRTIEQTGVVYPIKGIHMDMFYMLNDDGTKKWQHGYEIDLGEESYRYLSDPEKETPAYFESAMTKVDAEAINERYNEIGKIEHSFTPFVSDEEKTEGKEEEKDESVLSDDDVKEVMRKNYSKLEELLQEENINDLYDKYYDVDDAEKIWKSGVDPSSPFYEDVYELLYPKAKDLVAEEGMESLINEKFSMFWQPPAPISFYGPSPDLEVLEKDSESFKIKQTKEIGPQEKGGTSHDLVYIVKYVKEDGKWKFAGARKQE